MTPQVSSSPDSSRTPKPDLRAGRASRRPPASHRSFPDGGAFSHVPFAADPATRQFRTLTRITALNPDNIVARMASAMIALLDDTDTITAEGLMTRHGFSAEQVEGCKTQALALAQKFAPHLFRQRKDIY